MKRAEVWWVTSDPSIGGEIRKKRPAVIISNAAKHTPCFHPDFFLPFGYKSSWQMMEL